MSGDNRFEAVGRKTASWTRLTARFPLQLALMVALGGALTAQGTEPKPNLIVLNSVDSTVSLLQIQGRGSRLVKTLPVGSNPRAVAIRPDGTRAYIVNAGDQSLREKGLGSVSVLDLGTLSVAATITHPNLHFPHGIAMSRDGRKVYVTTLYQNSVFVFSTASNEVLKEIPTGKKATFMIAMTPDGTRAYVSHAEEPGFVTIVDTATDTMVGTIEGLGFEPQGITVTPDGKTVLVTNYDDSTLSFIDTRTNRLERTIGVGLNPLKVVVAADGRFAFTSALNDHSVSVVDLRNDRRQMVKQIPVGRQPVGMSLSDDGFLYVTNMGEDSITVIDTALMDAVRQIPVGKAPFSLSVWK